MVTQPSSGAAGCCLAQLVDPHIFLPNLPGWLRKEKPWQVLCCWGVLSDSLPHTTNACRRFEERSSAKATDNPPSCSFFNCLCCAITFLQLIHQHPLLPVFRRCTLFFSLSYWWPIHNPLWSTLVCHSQIMRASIAWKNKFCLQAMPIKSSVSLDQERKSLSVYPECIPQSTQLNDSVPLIFYALAASFYIHIIVSIILCSPLVPHTHPTN